MATTKHFVRNEIANYGSLPASGDTNVLYELQDNGSLYRWDYVNSVYVPWSTVGSGQTLSQVLINGNISGANDIIVTDGQFIRSSGNTNSINLDSSGSNAWDITSDQYSQGSAWVYGQKDNGSQLAFQLDGSEAIGVGVWGDGISSLLYNGKEINIHDNRVTDAITTNVDRRAIFIGNKSSIINSGVTNTVVIGGSNISATTSNTVYVPVLNINDLPSNDNALSQVLVRANDGTVKYKDISSFTDMNVTGGTYDVNTGVVTFTNNSGGTFNVTGFTSGMTDSYTTTAYTVGNVVRFDNNIQGSNLYSVDLTNMLNTGGPWTAGTGTNSAVLAGSDGVASGTSSVSEGYNTIANGDYSHAEGYATTSSGFASHSEGNITTASGESSHAEGNNTTASSDNAHAEGQNTIASGENSHSQNINTQAIGLYTHAGGNGSIAFGETSFIHSTNSLVSGDRSVVLGGQNITGATSDTVYVPNFETRGGSIFNQDGGNFDFRVEGDTNTHLVFVDASTDRVGINNSAPDSKLSISTLEGDGISFDGMTDAALVGKHKFYTKQGEIGTTGTNTSTIATIPLVSGDRITLRGIITGIGTGSLVVGGTFSAVGDNAAGTASIIGSVDTSVKSANSIGSPTFTVSTSGGNIIITVTGGGEDTQWVATYEYQIVSEPVV